MPAHSFLVVFDRHLLRATIPGHSVHSYSETEVAAIRAAAYREGSDSAQAFAERQLVEFRDEVHALQQGIFQHLHDIESALIDQIRRELPNLAMDIARRMLAGFEPPQELVLRLCSEALEQLFPERENLELVVSSRDAEMLSKHGGDLQARFPGLKIRADATLQPGDCIVHSRFGITDARQSAKLGAIEHELIGAA